MAVSKLLQPALPPRPGRTLYVQSTMSAPLLMQGEVLVYVVEGQSKSVIARHFDIDIIGANRAGFTVVDDARGAASEVYLKATHSVGELALVICHEIIHNKVNMATDLLHKRGGLCGSPPGPPTSADYALLRPRLAAPQLQWLDGFRA